MKTIYGVIVACIVSGCAPAVNCKGPYNIEYVSLFDDAGNETKVALQKSENVSDLRELIGVCVKKDGSSARAARQGDKCEESEVAIPARSNECE